MSVSALLIAMPLARFVTLALVGMTALAGALVVAAIVAQWMGTYADARRARNWARWEPALLDALTGDREPQSVGLLVTPRQRRDFFELIVAYALRLGGDSRTILAEAASMHVDAALQLLSHHRADRRALAAHLVGLVGGPEERQRLTPLLWDPSLDVAMTVARALARSGDGALRRLVYVPAAETAAAVLSEDTDREVTAAVLRLLRDIGGPEQADAIRPFCDHADPVLRLHGISALSALSLAPSDAARIEYALRDESSWVSLRAARGLIESGRVAALQTVASGAAPEAAIARQALAEAGYSVAA